MTTRLSKFVAAAERIRSADGNPRASLIEAGREFWEALFDRDLLPADLCTEADAIVAAILAEGRIERTVGHMEDAEVAHVAARIVDFADAVHRTGLA